MPIVDIEIEDFSKRGFGIGFKGQTKVEVAHTVLGDVVEVDLLKKKKGVRKGRLLKLLKASKLRVEPRCSHAGICGGCTWKQMDYLSQLNQKEKMVQDAFQDILLKNSVHLYPIIPCPFPWQYRNKMEFTFSQNRANTRFLGLMIAHAKSYVFNLEKCHLAKPWFSDVVNSVRDWWQNFLELQAYNPYKNEGHLRYLTLREGVNTDEKMIVLTVSGNPDYEISEKHLEEFVLAVLKNFSIEERKKLSIYLRIQKIAKKIPTKFIEKHLFGLFQITEILRLNGGKILKKFRISPTSFFQPNTLQAEKLYDTALSMLDSSEEFTVYDLYSGTGTLGMAIASRVKKVIGIEQNPQAVKDAHENLLLNKIQNFFIYEGDVGKVITNLMSEKDFISPDVVIIDPPRAGLDPLTLHHLKSLKPKKILYISCNPITQAENIKELLEAGYKLQKLQPIDQFPHTVHIETIALLEI